MNKYLFIIIFFFFLACNKESQIFEPINPSLLRWEQLKGPEGGSVSKLLAVKETLFALADDGLYYRKDNLTTWEMTNLKSSKITSLFNDCSNNLFVINNNTLLISSDFGQRWSEKTIRSNTTINCIAIKGDGIIFAGTCGSGVLHSSNNGLSWREELFGSNSCINSFSINSTGIIFANTYNNGILYSADNAASWVQINTQPTGRMVDLLFINKNDEIFVYSNDKKLISSTDNGQNWESKAVSFPSTVTSMLSTKEGLFFGTKNGIYFSSDNGRNIMLSGLSNIPISSLTLDSNNTLFASTTTNGIFRKNARGIWETYNDGLFNVVINMLSINSAGTLIAGTLYNSNLYSYDFGNSWTPITSNFSNKTISFCTSNSKNEFFVVISDKTAYRSSDQCKTWSKLSLDISNEYAFIKSISFNSRRYLYACLTDGRIMKSTDNGNSWKTIYNFSGNLYGLSINVNDRLVAYYQPKYSTNNSSAILMPGLYYSDDDGKSWENIVSINGNMNFIVQDNKSNIFLSDFHNIYGTKRIRDKWIWDIFFSVAVDNITQFSSNLNGELFVSTSKGKLFYSADQGNNWQDISSTLPKIEIKSFTSDSKGNIFLGTNGKGIYRNKN